MTLILRKSAHGASFITENAYLSGKNKEIFTPFVTDEHPIALYEGAPPQYSSDGQAIDCALFLHVLLGTARILYKNPPYPCDTEDFFVII